MKKQPTTKVRATCSADVPALQRVLDDTELFPREMLPDMLRSFLTEKTNGEIWLTCEIDGEAVGFCYAVLEELTDGTWNMLAIAVLSSNQGGGIGSDLVGKLEDSLRERKQRLLIVDTSGTDRYARTRSFYRKNGYQNEARIRDYWAPGDDKVVFRKAL